jgi:hypothetical protein
MWTEGQTDGQTDMMKLLIAVLNFANTPKDPLYNNATLGSLCKF